MTALLVQTPPDGPVVVIGEPLTAEVLAPGPKRKPSRSISASPLMTTLDVANGTIVTVTFILRNIDERIYCSEVEWRVGEDVLETTQTDCTPFELADPEDLELQVVVKKILFKHRGRKTIRVALKKNKETVLWAEIEVNIK